jgi:acetyltransferase-like isoleucine patch superfamily enzyme
MNIKINNDFISLLTDTDVFTHWSYCESKNGKSWLLNFKSINISTEIIIESPSAFYCGDTPQQKWQCTGGLCTMGAYSYSHSFMPSEVKVGRYSSIAKGLKILDFSHPSNWLSSSVAFFTPTPLVSKSALAEYCDRKIEESKSLFERTPFDPRVNKPYPVIENDVWIGENVTLVLGVRIGNGAIVAANSTVTKDVPAYAIVAGCPAVIKKYRFCAETIEKLINSKWWEFDVLDFKKLDYQNPTKFIIQFNEIKNNLSIFKPKRIVIDTKGTVNVI